MTTLSLLIKFDSGTRPIDPHNLSKAIVLLQELSDRKATELRTA